MGGGKGAEPRTRVHIPAFADQGQVKCVCNGVPAIFLVDEKNFACRCPACIKREVRQGARSIVFTPTEYERHAGMAASKKWKYSVRVDDDDANPDGQQLTIGRWLDEAGEPHRKTATGRVRPGGSPCRLSLAGRPLLSPRRRSRCRRGRGTRWTAREEEEEEEEALAKQRRTRPTPGTSARRPRRPSKGRAGSSRAAGGPAAGRFAAMSRSPSVSDLTGPERANPDTKLRVKLKVGNGKPPQDLEIPEHLGSPPPSETKRWLLTQEQVAEQEALHVAVPPTPVQHKVSRVGTDFQARIPGLKEAPTVKPEGGNTSLLDERIGTPAPLEEEALAIAAGEEEEEEIGGEREEREREGWREREREREKLSRPLPAGRVAMGLPWLTTARVNCRRGAGAGDGAAAGRPLWTCTRRMGGWIRGSWRRRRSSRGSWTAARGSGSARGGSRARTSMGSGGGRGRLRREGRRPRRRRWMRTRRRGPTRAAGEAAPLPGGEGGPGKGAGARGGNREEEDAEEEEDGDEDEAQLQNWLLSDDRQVLSVAVVLDGVTYSGRLEAVRQLSVPRGARGGARKPRRVPSQQRMADSAGSADQVTDGFALPPPFLSPLTSLPSPLPCPSDPLPPPLSQICLSLPFRDSHHSPLPLPFPAILPFRLPSPFAPFS